MPTSTHERPQSPLDGIHIVDDFITNDLVSDNNPGAFDWQITAIGNGSTLSYVDGIPGGALRSTTVVTADGDGVALQSDTDALVLTAGFGGFAFRFRYPSVAGNALAGNNFRIGIDSSVTATAPTDGISIFSDAGVLTLRSDSADHGDTSIALTQPAGSLRTATSGTTAVLNKWHVIRVEWQGTNGQGGPRWVEAFIDNQPSGSVYCNIDDDESVELKIAHWQDSGGGDTLELDIDFFEFWQWYERDGSDAATV